MSRYLGQSRAPVSDNLITVRGRRRRRYLWGRTFALTLGEGFEAFMIVALIVAYLRRSDRVSLVPAVYWGIAVSLPASIAVAVLFQRG
jgi:high-affinity Fe2+/Pb2+ permease